MHPGSHLESHINTSSQKRRRVLKNDERLAHVVKAGGSERGRPRDHRHARYTLGHHPCSLAGSEEDREKGQ